MRRNHYMASCEKLLFVCQSPFDGFLGAPVFGKVDLKDGTEKFHVDISFRCSRQKGACRVLQVTTDFVMVQYDSEFHLFNPTTLAVHRFRPPYRNYGRQRNSSTLSKIQVTIGLMDNLNSYAIVCHCLSLDGDYKMKYMTWGVNDPLIPTNMRWIKVKSKCPRPPVPPGLVVQNFVFWNIFPLSLIGSSGDDELLVCLDLINDTFIVVDSPRMHSWSRGFTVAERKVSMLDIKGNLCIVDSVYTARTDHFEVWRLDLQTFEWVILFDIKKLPFHIGAQLGRFAFPYAHLWHRDAFVCSKSSPSGDLIMGGRTGDEIIIYNPNQENFFRSVKKPSFINGLQQLSVGFYWSRFMRN